jgi:hypothetical protein
LILAVTVPVTGRDEFVTLAFTVPCTGKGMLVTRTGTSLFERQLVCYLLEP